jgi:hypothetical protein
MRTPKIYVETDEYRFSHGRTPRGRGGWIFEIILTFSASNRRVERFEAQGTFQQARAAAKVEARNKVIEWGMMVREVAINVCP